MFLYRNRWRSSCSRIRRFEGAGRPILLLAMGVCLLSAVGCGTVTPLTTVPTNVVLPVGGVEVPVAIVTNQIYMDVMINGTGPHRFDLDTGSALSLISPTVADQFPANQLNSFTTLLRPGAVDRVRAGARRPGRAAGDRRRPALSVLAARPL